MSPLFLTIEQVLSMHRDQIDRYGGSPELRDRGLLESALAQPMASFGGQYMHEDLAAMAAAYLFHLVMNHPFVDGNKRIGAVASRTFLLVNDCTFNPDEAEFEDLVMSVARGELKKDGVAEFIRRHIEQ